MRLRFLSPGLTEYDVNRWFAWSLLGRPNSSKRAHDSGSGTFETQGVCRRWRQ